MLHFLIPSHLICWKLWAKTINFGLNNDNFELKKGHFGMKFRKYDNFFEILVFLVKIPFI